MIAEDKPTTECPLCGGTVFLSDSKCRYCGTVLQETESGRVETREEANKSDRYGPALLWAAPAGIIVLLGWVGRLNMLQNPQPWLMLIVAITVIVSAVLVVFEAAAIGTGYGKKDSGEKLNLTPFKWFLFVLLLWPVGFPLYCRERRRYGLKNRFEPAAICVVLFLAAAVGLFYKMNHEIGQHEKELQRIQSDLNRRQARK